MKDQRKSAKDGRNADPMAEMRERYERAVEADRENREKAIEDLKFVTIPGSQWDDHQRKMRKGRPCYEFPILRSHWRQVVNDQKKARPAIKVRPVEDADVAGAELRQGIIRNIEQQSNAESAYDSAFETLTAAGMGSWRIVTAYASDDAWEQDLRVRPIADPLTSVWLDPDDHEDPGFGFIEETMSRERFKAKYPKADAVSFESAKSWDKGNWFGESDVRVAEYWRKVPVKKTLLLLSDGRTVNAAEVDPAALAAQGVEVLKSRECNGHKVVMSIVSGKEELAGPFETVFNRIPVVVTYANRHKIDGKWHWCGMVRFSRDPQKLLNYNLTTAQEVVSKQPKSPYLLTPKMLEGDGVKRMWDNSNASDLPYLPYTPDASAPGGRPVREAPPDMPSAFTMLTQISVDMLKASDGIFDASVGARSNETSGKAIMARQQEGDTATFDYQDALSKSIRLTGEILVSALPKVYDTPRVMRVIGKDGAEDWRQLYQENPDGTVINDLSAGKYDVAVSTGPGYDTQRMEFIDALTQLGQGNPLIAQGVPDLIVGAMDFPKAEEAAERLKLLLPPPIQAKLAEGKDLPPEVVQAQQQVQQMAQQAQEMMQAAQEAMQQAQQEAAGVESDKAQTAAQKSQIQADIRVATAELDKREAQFEAMQARFDAHVAKINAGFAQREAAANTPDEGASGEVAA